MTVKRVLIALSILLVGGAAAAFLTFYEHYEEEVDRGWGSRAKRNPYLAAEQFLSTVGLQTRRADNISVLGQLTPEDTLYLTSSSQIYNAERAQELLRWIERGGHAVVVAHHGGEGERDWLLEELDVTLEEGSDNFYFNPLRRFLGEEVEKAEQYAGKSASELLREHNRKVRAGEDPEAEEADSAEQSADDTAEPEAPRNPDVEPSQLVTLASEGGDYQLYFDPGVLLWHPALDGEEIDGGPVFWAGMDSEDAGVPFMQFERGDGLITLLADDSLWQSDRIGQFDHAYLLGWLASDGDFVFLTRPRFDSLLVLARRYAAEFFLAGALALLAWLLLRSRRFGQRAPQAETARRSLLEHISACGHYYWRADKCAALLIRYRDSLLRRLGGENAPQSLKRSLCTRLSADTGLSESQIANCLWGEAPQSEETFTERMRNLQQIEAAL